MKPTFSITPVRAATLASLTVLATGLGGCSLLGINTSGDSIDYRNGAAKTATLEVPPDLTPLAADNRYLPQSGAISANALASGAPRVVSGPGASGTTPTVAIQQAGDVRLERAGSQMWLVTSMTPEQVWPKARQFWVDRGFAIAAESAEAGTLETDFAQNRAKLPKDLVRKVLGSVLDNVYDTGERDRYMMRVERSSAGSEIYVSHHGIEEQQVGRANEGQFQWVARPSDPQLEREMLTRLMISLGAKGEVARAEVAATGSSTASAKARIVTGRPGAALQVDDALERAWRRIGLALDRGGFTVEDRDRNQGIYFVRFVDTKEAAKDEPNFFTRLFGAKDPTAKALNRYRIQVKADGAATLVSVLNYSGEPDNSANAQKIVSLLVDELKR